MPEVATPVTPPVVAFTETVVLAELQVPPVVASVNMVVSPEQTLSLVLIAVTAATTVTVSEVAQPVGKV